MNVLWPLILSLVITIWWNSFTMKTQSITKIKSQTKKDIIKCIWWFIPVHKNEYVSLKRACNVTISYTYPPLVTQPKSQIVAFRLKRVPNRYIGNVIYVKLICIIAGVTFDILVAMYHIHGLHAMPWMQLSYATALYSPVQTSEYGRLHIASPVSRIYLVSIPWWCKDVVQFCRGNGADASQNIYFPKLNALNVCLIGVQ